jgi:hypothetical protein
VTARSPPSREVGFGAVGHVAAPEPTSVGMRGPEPYDMWQHRSPPQSIGEVWSHRTHGSTGAHLGRVVRFGAVGHVAAPDPTSAEKKDLE